MDRREKRRRARERKELEEKLRKEASRTQAESQAKASRLARALGTLTHKLTGTRVIWSVIVASLTMLGGWALLRPHISVEPYIPLNPVDPYSTQFTVKNENSIFAAHDINCVCWPRQTQSEMVSACSDPHQFSWLREVGIPAFFVVLGAALGFFASYFLEKQKARREERQAEQAKASFLRAIGMELDALGDQLDASLYEMKGSIERAKSGTGPHIAATLRTSVFTTQLGKVKDVGDLLMIQVIHFYSDLGTLQEVVDAVNSLATEYNRSEAGPRHGAQSRLLSGLRVLEEKIAGFGKRLGELKAKLKPVASTSTGNR